MKLNVEQVKAAISGQRDFLRSTYHVKDLGVFGSVAKGQNTEESDIDLLVEFSEPIGFFKFVELERYLSTILKKDVDLISKKALRPVIKDNILSEVIYI